MALRQADQIRAKVPPQFQPKMESGQLPRTFGEVSAVDKREAEREFTIKNLSRDAETPTVGSGYMALYQGEQNSLAARRKDEKRKEADRAMRRALMLQNMDGYIDWLGDQIDEIDSKLTTLDEIEDLVRRGEFDLDNATHLAMLAQVGIDQDEFAEDPNGVLADTRDELTIAKAEYQTELAQVEDMKTRYENAPDEATREQIAGEFTTLRNSGEDGAILADGTLRQIEDDVMVRDIVEDAGFNEAEQDTAIAWGDTTVLSGGFGPPPAEAGTPPRSSVAQSIDPVTTGKEPLSATFARAADGDQAPEMASQPDAQIALNTTFRPGA